MATILLTSGPTRQYLDPVRYLTNASSGRMGAALASAILDRGHTLHIVTGPVAVTYPDAATVHPVTTTDEMLDCCRRLFPQCDGAIGAAAPCDYRPRKIAEGKIAKDGEPLVVELVETPDVIADLGKSKRRNQWTVAFALETEDRRFRAMVKLERKLCDLVISNGPAAIDSTTNAIEIIDAAGETVFRGDDDKTKLAVQIVDVIQRRLLSPNGSDDSPLNA